MTTELKKKTRRKARKHSLISEHYDGIVEKMKSRRKGVPDYYYELNAEQRELNGMIMESMNHKVNYLKNPRYRNLKKTIQYADVSPHEYLLTGILGDRLYSAGPNLPVSGDSGGHFVRGLQHWACLFQDSDPNQR